MRSSSHPRDRFQRALWTLALAVPLAVSACSTADTDSPEPTDAPIATSAATEPPTFPISVIDDENTTVSIPKEPQRIVSLTPATTEILFAIGAGPRVVAKVEDIANYPPEASKLPVVATYKGVDVEKIISMGADLVISGGTGLSQGDADEQLRRANIPVLVIYPTTIDGALDGMKVIGDAVGERDAANDLADSIDGAFGAVDAQVETLDTPRVFYEIDDTNGIFTPPENSIYNEMLDAAGADPIAGDSNYQISLEKLVAADPQIILLGDAAYCVTPEAVKKRPGWGGMTAVKSGKIFPVDDIVITRPGPRLVDGLLELVDAIHPDVADDLPSPAPRPTPATSSC